MAEATQIAVAGGTVPPIPAGAVTNENRMPPASSQTPGYVANPANQADQYVVPPKTPTVPGMSAEEQAEFAEFQAFKAAKAAGAPPGEANPAAANPPTNPSAALDLAVNAAKHDPILDSMLGIFDSAASGIDRARALGNALTHGDASLVDVAYLREVGGPNAERLLTLAKGIVQHCNAAATQATQAVYALAGGETQWAAATAAFNRSAPDHLKQFVAHALNSGNQSQISAGAQSVVEFARTTGKLSTPGAGFVQTGGGAPGSAQGLSKEAFQAAHAALDKNDRQYERLKGELYGRRQIGRQLGL